MQKLLIWPKEVTLVSRTEPSGPLCLWQRLNNYGTTYWSITPRPSTVSNVRFTFVYDLPRISIFWLVTWISNKEKTTYFLPRKVQSAEPWHPYYEKCLSTFHLLLLHIFDFTWTYIQFGRQCFWLHCCKWYVATWEHWCQKAFSRASDEPGIETEDKMHSMRMFQFLTARQNLVIRINISLTFFWFSNAQNLVFRINILLTLSLVLKFLVLFFTSARWSSSPFFHEPFHSWLHKCTMVFMRMLVVALAVNNSEEDNEYI